MRGRWLVRGLLGVAGLVVLYCFDCGLHFDQDGSSDLARVQLERLCEVLQRYAADQGDMPSDDEGLAALTSTDLKRGELLDPWGQTIEYTAPTSERPAVLRTPGQPDAAKPISLACDPAG